MLASAYLAVLQKLYTELMSSPVNWVITGSCGFALQGIPVQPGDIDLQTDEIGAYEIERRFAAYSIKKVTFSATDKIRSHFGALSIDNIKVEIMGDIQKRLEDGSWEAPVHLAQHRRTVLIAGMEFPVLSFRI